MTETKRDSRHEWAYEHSYLLVLEYTPHLITNPGPHQTHPPHTKTSVKDRNVSEKNPTAGVNGEEKTIAHPMIYDAIKSAAGADVKVKGKK